MTNFFGSTVVNNVLAELFVSYESVVDTQVVLLFALLLERMGVVVFSVPWVLPITVPMGSSFLHVAVWNRKEIHCVWNEFLIVHCSFRKKCPHVQWTMPMSQYDEHTLHCVLESMPSNSHNSMLPNFMNHLFFDL